MGRTSTTTGYDGSLIGSLLRGRHAAFPIVQGFSPAFEQGIDEPARGGVDGSIVLREGLIAFEEAQGVANGRGVNLAGDLVTLEIRHFPGVLEGLLQLAALLLGGQSDHIRLGVWTSGGGGSRE
jgi:hypothetical protein